MLSSATLSKTQAKYITRICIWLSRSILVSYPRFDPNFFLKKKTNVHREPRPPPPPSPQAKEKWFPNESGEETSPILAACCLRCAAAKDSRDGNEPRFGCGRGRLNLGGRLSSFPPAEGCCYTPEVKLILIGPYGHTPGPPIPRAMKPTMLLL